MKENNASAPATKSDIKMLMDSIGKLYDAHERWKTEVLDANESWKTEIIEHMDLTTELIRDDFLDAKKDRVADHEHRLKRIERKVGLIAA